MVGIEPEADCRLMLGYSQAEVGSDTFEGVLDDESPAFDLLPS